jgi:hypothetical protein
MTPMVAREPAVRIPDEVAAFAAEQGVSAYLPAVLRLAEQIFAGLSLSLRLEGDPEIEDDWHIVIDVNTADWDLTRLMTSQNQWSEEIFTCCPASHVCIFRLGMA